MNAVELLNEHPEKVVAAYFKDQDGNPLILADYQTEFIKAVIKRDKTRFIYKACTQSGKSCALSVVLALFAIFFPNERIVNVSCTELQARIIFDQTKKFLVEDHVEIRKMVDLSRSIGSRKEFSKTKMFMKNGTEIKVLSTGMGETASVGNSLLGMSATILVIDEAASIPNEVFTTKILRMLGASRTVGLEKILILSSTPQTSNFFEEAWYDPEYEKFTVDWKQAVDAGRMDLKTVMEQKRKMTKSNFDMWYNANFPNMLEDSVYDMDEVKENTVDQDFQFYGEKILSVDIARYGRDFTIYALIDKVEETYRVVDFLQDEKKDTVTVAGRIVSLNNEHKFDHVFIDEGGIGCLVKGTEVLTSNGWKTIEKLKEGDLIYSKNNSHIQFEKVNSILEKETEIIHLEKGYSFSSGQTFYLKTRNAYPLKLHSWETATKLNYFTLDNEFNWLYREFGFELKGLEVKMPNGGIKKTGVKTKISGQNFAKLLGWYQSEGNLDKCSINISQSEKSKHLKDIEKSITECGLKFTKKISKVGEVKYVVYSKELRDWCEKECYHSKPHHSHTKIIPTWLKYNSKEVIQSFLEEYNKGDGTIHHGSREYFTCSKDMAEGLLELVYKSGRYGNIRIKQKKGSESSIHGRKIVRKHDFYVVYEWKRRSISISPKIIKRELGKTYDVRISGSSKLFMVRFKDKRAFWVHNGGPLDIVRSKGIEAVGVLAGSKCTSKEIAENCSNLKAELHMKAKKLFETGKLKVIDKGTLFKELRGMRKDWTPNGKIKIIDPDKSPDYVDALVYSLYKPNYGTFVIVDMKGAKKKVGFS